MRYFDRATRTEVLPNIHPLTETVVELPDNHPFFSPLPPGMALDYTPAGLPVLVALAVPAVTVAELCNAIDAAADAARRAVAGDPLRAVEYERAAAEAQVFKDAGYPANAVPRTVSAWAIGERTAQQAADSILQEAVAFNEALYQLREARLGAKEQVRTAMTTNNAQLAQNIAAATIAGIAAAVAGIGNNT